MSADQQKESNSTLTSKLSDVEAWKSVLENIVSFATASTTLVENISNTLNLSTNSDHLAKPTLENTCIGDCDNTYLTCKTLTSPEYFLTDFPFFMDHINVIVAPLNVFQEKPKEPLVGKNSKFDFTKWTLDKKTLTSPKRGSRPSSKSSKLGYSTSVINLYKSPFMHEKNDKFNNNRSKIPGNNRTKVTNNAIVAVRSKVSKETLTKSKFRNNIKALISNSNDLREPIKKAILSLEKEDNKHLPNVTDDKTNSLITPQLLATTTEMLDKKFENLKPALQESSKPVKIRAQSPEELIAQKLGKLQKKKSKIKSAKSPTRTEKSETKKVTSSTKKEENMKKSASSALFQSLNKTLRPKSVASNVKSQKNYANIHNLQPTPSIPLKLFTTVPKATKTGKAKATTNQKELKTTKSEGKAVKKPRTAPDKTVPSFEIDKKATETIHKVVAKKSKPLKKEGKKKVDQSQTLEKEKIVVEKTNKIKLQ